MSTVKPRINMTLEPEDHERLRELAERTGRSLSEQARTLLLEMMEILEDGALSSLAAERRGTYSRDKAMSHEDVWGKTKTEKKRKKRSGG